MTTATATRPTDTWTDEADFGWAEIPKMCKPSKCVSTDDLRPTLQHGFVRHTEDGTFLYTTNSYVLAEIPISFGPDVDGEKVLPEIAIPLAALKALDASKGRFRLFDGLIEIEGRADLYRPGPDDLKAPNHGSLFPAPKAKPMAIEAVGLNPHLTVAVAEALGATDVGIRVEFYGPLRSVLMTPMGRPGRGLQMPIRLSA